MDAEHAAIVHTDESVMPTSANNSDTHNGTTCTWKKLIIRADKAESEQISDTLFTAGAQSVTFLDAADQPIFEPDPQTMPLWDQVYVQALFPVEQSLNTVISQLQNQLSANPLQYKTEILEDKDWVREWMDQFQPMLFGHNLWICPSWLPPVDPDAVNIMLDPGIAFGTGTHATTALCLRWLDAQAAQQGMADKIVIDYGCGSGILSLAALALGAKKVYALDIDPQAISATKENARKNQLENHLQLYLADEFKRQSAGLKADFLLANILAEPLIALASEFARLLSPGGTLVLSGILCRQVDQVYQAYLPWFDIAQTTLQDDWARIIAKRKESR